MWNKASPEIAAVRMTQCFFVCFASSTSIASNSVLYLSSSFEKTEVCKNKKLNYFAITLIHLVGSTIRLLKSESCFPLYSIFTLFLCNIACFNICFLPWMRSFLSAGMWSVTEQCDIVPMQHARQNFCLQVSHFFRNLQLEHAVSSERTFLFLLLGS